MTSNYTISGHGDLGDEIVAMPIARHLGKADFLLWNSPLCKPIEPRIHLIKELMESQDYVGRVEIWDRQEPITHDCATFRDGGIFWGKNLCSLHAEWVGIKNIDQSPWLTVTPNKQYEGKIVCNRSTRHQNQFFPWREIAAHYQKDLIFIGLWEEWRQLSNEVGFEIPYVSTKDLLECAEIIAASKLFIGNQSSNINLAFGLGKRFICEGSWTSCDCLYERDGLYVFDGEIPESFTVDGYKPLVLPSRLRDREIRFDVSPPGQYWIVTSPDGEVHKALNAKSVLREANRHESANNLYLTTEKELARQMIERFPTFGTDGYQNTIHTMIHNAKQILHKMGNPYV